MRIVNHEVQEIVEVPDDFEEMLRHIEKIGRICYQSQERITEDSAENFVKMLFRRGHWAMLEHSWLVFTSYPLDWDQWHHLYELTDSRFLQVLVDDRDERIPIICGNWRAWFEQIIGPAKDNKNKFELFKQLPDIINDLFSAYDITLFRVPLNDIEDPYLYPKAYTATFLTDRAVTHEMVRHRPCAFAQKSQRFCADREYLEFIAPYYLDLTSDSSTGVYMWTCLMNRIEEDYHFALRNGQTAQEARSMLPNCTATQIAMTADIVEWEHVFDMRCASDAYPPIRKLMREVKETFQNRGYIKDKQK